MDPILHLALDCISADHLPRDRATSDPAALDDLVASIAQNGLRQPIEVWVLSTPEPPFTHGLISGYRRLAAHRRLAELRQDASFTTIAAFLRAPTSVAAALAAMVEENECRADISPWEKARLITVAVSEGLFETPDAAIAALHPLANRQKVARLRACVHVVEELEGLITTPEKLNENRMLRLASALRGGLIEVFQHILKGVRGQNIEYQWSAISSALIEADLGEPEFPATIITPARPRRILTLPQGLTIRRELSPSGYYLRFSGPEARRGGLMDDVMDAIERLFIPHADG